mgnify:CR=1 FL=1
MFNFTFKKIIAPVSNETTKIDAIQLWYVRWTSRYDKFAGSTRYEIEAFVSEQLANHFADALRNAFQLLRHTSDTMVIVEKRAGV